jgi:hypothetical protein
MRGTDPSQPGKMWKRFDIWDSRKMKAPEPVGIVYEQIDKFRYIEPNRCQLSSYFKLFHKMDQYFHYENWLDLHQTEFEDRPFNCSILLTDIAKSGPKAKEMHQSNILWGQSIIDAWLKAGFRPVPTPEDLLYNATQTRYFQQNWGPLHEKMNIINTEVKNNSPDASADFQVEAQTIPITKSIERLLS